MLDCHSHILRLLITIAGCSLMIRKCSLEEEEKEEEGMSDSVCPLETFVATLLWPIVCTLHS